MIGVPGFDEVTAPSNSDPQTVIVSLDRTGPCSTSRGPNWIVGHRLLLVLRDGVAHRYRLQVAPLPVICGSEV